LFVIFHILNNVGSICDEKKTPKGKHDEKKLKKSEEIKNILAEQEFFKFFLTLKV